MYKSTSIFVCSKLFSTKALSLLSHHVEDSGTCIVFKWVHLHPSILSDNIYCSSDHAIGGGSHQNSTSLETLLNELVLFEEAQYQQFLMKNFFSRSICCSGHTTVGEGSQQNRALRALKVTHRRSSTESRS